MRYGFGGGCAPEQYFRLCSLFHKHSLSLESLTIGQAPLMGIQVRSLKVSILEENLGFTEEQPQNTRWQIVLGWETRKALYLGCSWHWETAPVIDLSVMFVPTPCARHLYISRVLLHWPALARFKFFLMHLRAGILHLGLGGTRALLILYIRWNMWNMSLFPLGDR